MPLSSGEVEVDHIETPPDRDRVEVEVEHLKEEE